MREIDIEVSQRIQGKTVSPVKELAPSRLFFNDDRQCRKRTGGRTIEKIDLQSFQDQQRSAEVGRQENLRRRRIEGQDERLPVRCTRPDLINAFPPNIEPEDY